MRICIVIPAHNEEYRLVGTLEAYHKFFKHVPPEDHVAYELLVVANNCSDNTVAVAQAAQKKYGHTAILDIPQGGKGLAVAAGFREALKGDFTHIGFVDADMATAPRHFYHLIEELMPHHAHKKNDGVIASRYMAGAQVTPKRPWIKSKGKRWVYDPLVWLLFGIKYADTQCGAKLFTRKVVEATVDELSVAHFAFDVELLYLCHKYGFKVPEVPTVWHDQPGSKLHTLRSGLRMLSALVALRWRHMCHKRKSEKRSDDKHV